MRAPARERHARLRAAAAAFWARGARYDARYARSARRSTPAGMPPRCGSRARRRRTRARSARAARGMKRSVPCCRRHTCRRVERRRGAVAARYRRHGVRCLRAQRLRLPPRTTMLFAAIRHYTLRQLPRDVASIKRYVYVYMPMIRLPLARLCYEPPYAIRCAMCFAALHARRAVLTQRTRYGNAAQRSDARRDTARCSATRAAPRVPLQRAFSVRGTVTRQTQRVAAPSVICQPKRKAIYASVRERATAQMPHVCRRCRRSPT